MANNCGAGMNNSVAERAHGPSLTDKISEWGKVLEGDPDKEFLLDGITHGFRIVDEGAILEESFSKNYLSATHLHFGPTNKQILKEIENGHYICSDIKPTIVSAIGAIPKRDSPDIRIIHDCSRPPGKSVNSHATLRKEKFQTIDEAVKLIKPGYFMAKVDLKNAYRSVRIHPSNYEATGLSWKFKSENYERFLYDSRLPFGARKSPSIFHRITQAVRREMKRRGFDLIITYLDDFLIIGPSFETCKQALDELIKLLRDLGFQINWSKVSDPATRVVFLGIAIDSMNGTLELPKDKVVDLKECLTKFVGKVRASKLQLQVLAGKLNWACQAVRGGRSFLRRILDDLRYLQQGKHKRKLSKDFQCDIHWWLTFLDTFNGTVLFMSPSPLDLFVDASTGGSGVAFGRDWLFTHWWSDWPEAAKLHINHKETLSILLAARRWGPIWSNSVVTVYTDNTTAKAAINKATSSNKMVMTAIRELFWLSVTYNFQLVAVYVPGKLNTLADAISRLHQPGYLKVLDSICDHTLSPGELRFHMSKSALLTILQPVLKWWLLKLNWTQQWPDIKGQPLQFPHRKHTLPTGRPS